MDTFGRHHLVEFHGCNCEVLNDLKAIEQMMKQAATVAKCTVVGTVFHPFQPQGVSGVVVIEESHLSIHTWPEHGYAAVDFYTCGDGAPEAAELFLRDKLQAASSETMRVERGLVGPHSMRAVSHTTKVSPALAPANSGAGKEVRAP